MDGDDAAQGDGGARQLLGQLRVPLVRMWQELIRDAGPAQRARPHGVKLLGAAHGAVELLPVVSLFVLKVVSSKRASYALAARRIPHRMLALFAEDVKLAAHSKVE
jgi:hypothetical protein